MSDILSREDVKWAKGDFQPCPRGGPVRTRSNSFVVLELITTIEAHDEGRRLALAALERYALKNPRTVPEGHFLGCNKSRAQNCGAQCQAARAARAHAEKMRKDGWLDE